jgi:hypothetical protein
MFLGYFAEQLLLGFRFFLLHVLVFVIAFSFLAVGITVFLAFLLPQILQRLEGSPFGRLGAACWYEQGSAQTDYPGDMFIFHDEYVFWLVCGACLEQGILIAGYDCVNKMKNRRDCENNQAARIQYSGR